MTQHWMSLICILTTAYRQQVGSCNKTHHESVSTKLYSLMEGKRQILLGQLIVTVDH